MLKFCWMRTRSIYFSVKLISWHYTQVSKLQVHLRYTYIHIYVLVLSTILLNMIEEKCNATFSLVLSTMVLVYC